MGEPIAIIGISCRFPGADNPEAFWHLLRNGVDGITEVSPERWDREYFYAPESVTPGKMNTRWGGFLEQIDGFDPSFFQISPREAEQIDPQQRLLLEVTWEALENAGIPPNQLKGSQTGVFIGISNSDYFRLITQEVLNLTAYTGTGNAFSIAANRLSYWLDLKSPSVAIDTACSSSLVAVHLACQSLHLGESNLCLVGGVNLILSPEGNIIFSQAKMMAADGHCKTFDASADGYVRGEGCGIVVLKRLADALRDGDNIQAIIKGSAVNQDGLTYGLTAPNGRSQQVVIRQAMKNAGVTPAQISYIEAHGTGTPLGDPQEFNALKTVIMEGREPEEICWIGSAKTNIGHLESAAGIVGLIKVVLSLQHQEIPPHLHLKQLNPYISLTGTPLSIPTECQPWIVNGKTRLAGVSSFGFGGTNCHVILEEAPLENKKTRGQGDKEVVEPSWQLLTISAKNEQALTELAQRYVTYLNSHPDVSLGEICFTANTGRTNFEHRLAIITQSTAQLHQQLEAFTRGEETTGLIRGKIISPKPPKIAFLFTGQGSQYGGMGRQLYDTQPTFRAAIDLCNEILRPYLPQTLLEVIFAQKEETAKLSLLEQTAYTQPAIFALEYALVQLWQSWGIKPSIVMGHSVGEYVAACVAGVFSLEEGLKLIAQRGRLMQNLPAKGKMAAILADETTVRTAIEPYQDKVAIAAFNGPQSLVISGEIEAIELIIQELTLKGIKIQPLSVSHAFHSPLVEPILEEFKAIAQSSSFSQPQTPLISNVTGEIATADIATADYWCRHIRQPVKFSDSLNILKQQGYQLFLEVGAKPILLGMGRLCIPDAEKVWLPSLRLGTSDEQQMLQTLGELHVRGIPINWAGFYQDHDYRKIILPTYPFQRQRYWFKGKNAPSPSLLSAGMVNYFSQENTQSLLEKLAASGDFSAEEIKLLPKMLESLIKQQPLPFEENPLQDWLYKIEWQEKSPHLAPSHPSNKASALGNWLIFADTRGQGEFLAQLLQERGEAYFIVQPGACYQQLSPGVWQLNPTRPEEFECLLAKIAEITPLPLKGIIQLWSLAIESADSLTSTELESSQQLGCGSVLSLVQKLLKFDRFASTPLWVVTRGAVAVDGSLPSVAQSPVWGLGKAIALEMPQLWGGLIDLDPIASPETSATMLLAEITSPDGEQQVAFRNGLRYGARLRRYRLPQVQAAKFSLNADSTYLITGGLGGLGLKIAQWLIQRGVRYLVLVGRSKASIQAREAIAQMERAGVQIAVAQADVASLDDLTHLFQTIKESLPPLKGIFHTAGILDDGILLQQNWQQFAKVMGAKVTGTWNLHSLTQNLSLDFLVCFSSTTASLGAHGQGSYGAANTFMDALAYYRTSLGLPCLSINWGPWSDLGMAARLDKRYQTRLTDQGLRLIPPDAGIGVLEQLMQQSSPQVTVLPVDWSIFRTHITDNQRSFLTEVIGKTEDGETKTPLDLPQKQDFFGELQKTTIGDRLSWLTGYLKKRVALAFGLSSTSLDLHQSLTTMGIDSLMALELRNRIKEELELDIAMTKLMEEVSVMDLAAYLNEQFTKTKAMPPITTSIKQERKTQSTEEQDRLEQMENLSDEEVDKLLQTMLFEYGA